MLSAKWKGIRRKTEREREVRGGEREFSGEGGGGSVTWKKKEEGGGRKEGWWSCVSPRLADEMLRAEERSLSPATTNRARALMGAAAIKMRGEGGREGERAPREKGRKKWNYSSMVQITAGRLSGPSAITIMTTWCDMIVTALKENHSPGLGKR